VLQNSEKLIPVMQTIG